MSSNRVTKVLMMEYQFWITKKSDPTIGYCGSNWLGAWTVRSISGDDRKAVFASRCGALRYALMCMSRDLLLAGEIPVVSPEDSGGQ